MTALGIFLVACGGDDAENPEDSDERFPANQQIGPMSLHVPEAWEEFDVESSDKGEATGFSEAQDGTAERYVMTRTDFPGARNVGSANRVMFAEVQYRGGQIEEVEEVEIAGADVAWRADLAWPGDRGEVTARYWIAHDEDSGVIAAAEYGGYWDGPGGTGCLRRDPRTHSGSPRVNGKF
ncbi:MAG: hypothetical protein ACTHWO_09530 [Nesterenkonia sp.]